MEGLLSTGPTPSSFNMKEEEINARPKNYIICLLLVLLLKLLFQPDSDDDEEVDQADPEDRLHEEIAALYSLKVVTNSK